MVNFPINKSRVGAEKLNEMLTASFRIQSMTLIGGGLKSYTEIFSTHLT